MVIAHRGYSSVTPENTLAAMVAGDRVGSRYVETDVQTAADGTQVVMHDNKVDRTTDGTGDISALPGAQVTGLDAGSWFNKVFAAQKAPEFGNFLEVVKAGSADLLLEVKGPETDAEVRAIIDTVRKHGMVERTVLQLDGKPVTQGQVVEASSLALGKHTVTATARGEGGEATATSTFTVVATEQGVRARLAGLEVSTGVLQQMLTALEGAQYDRLAQLVTKRVPAGDARQALLDEIASLR